MTPAWPETTPVDWSHAYRLILAKYPPVPLFERIADPADWEELLEIAALTDPQARQAAGRIDLVPVEQRLSGPNASWIMAAFTHPNPAGSRFSDGRFGVYYAAAALTTALAETIYHRERFHQDAADAAQIDTLRLLMSRVRGALHDVRRHTLTSALSAAYPALYSLSDYRDGQRLAAALRDQGRQGIIYDSVRHPDGTCVAVFDPRLLTVPEDPERFLALHWNGTAIDGYFDYRINAWRWKSSNDWLE